ncbi:trans-acting enoyl reductase family protein [Caulobacter sp. UNC279MFTsu5.1]|uniref:saccharopine dehydrogenase family protein n=1 Tax=Caulobacter sp. UNC279MFTsu5.1 TaxID=1502775 RepID=UPI0008E8CA35|nr:saccharopine dehydrogenase NADP-binding domain-containing protein [Caulobacter sp. UNC279MFTsu5.1]SFJ67839.1 Uncharacterized conserved protein [Caulobacter sp. UNC279MFTsu5.1]
MTGFEGSRRRVAVFGAAGHTGRFVVEELRRRGLAPVAVGRRAEALQAAFPAGVEIRTATVEDAAGLDRAFEGAAAVINCAGPFLDTADAVVSAALRAGAHYIDVSAEQPSAQAVFDRFDGPARAAGLVVLPAMGFYGGLSDLLVTAAMGDWTEADDIRIGIGLDRWWPTEGTRVTGARNTAPRQVIAAGRLAPLAHPAPRLAWTFPAPFGAQEMVEVPFSEVVVIARHLKTASLDTFLSETALKDVRDAATPPPEAADDSGLSAQRFVVETIVRRAGRTRRAVATGRDIYGFTAPLVCEAVQRLLAGDVRVAGALAPGQVFDAGDLLRSLPFEALAVDL